MRLSLFALLCILLASCTEQNPPVQIKEVHLIRNRYDSLSVYLVLSDKDSIPVATEGSYSFSLRDPSGPISGNLYKQEGKVTDDDFALYSLGGYPVGQKTLAARVGKLTRSDFLKYSDYKVENREDFSVENMSLLVNFYPKGGDPFSKYVVVHLAR